MDELELREAEEYLNSPEAKILGASPEARQLVRRSRNELEEIKRRQAEELEEAIRRAEEQERLHEAEAKRADAERVRAEAIIRGRRRERIFSATIFILGIITLIAVGTFALFLNAQAREHKKTAKRLRDRAKDDLAEANETNPIRNVTALRNLSAALILNSRDTEAATLARNLLLQGVWCPPAKSDVRYEEDALLAATFAPQRNNNKIFAAAGNGQLLRVVWKDRALKPVGSIFEKPEIDDQHLVQPGFASFSPDGQWLLVVPPIRISATNVEAAAQGPPQPRAGVASSEGSGQQTCKLQILRWMPQNDTYKSAEPDLDIQAFPRGLITSFTWSADSDQVVLIGRQSGGSDPECRFFQVKENNVQEVPDRSAKLTEMKIVAIAFSPDRGRIAAVSSKREVTLIPADFQAIPDALKPLPEGFQPYAIVFGPGDDELTLASWGSIRILNIGDGNPRVPMKGQRTFRDQFMRVAVGPDESGTRLVATSLYGRVHVAKSSRIEEPAEPVPFRGSMGVPQFSPDGQRLLILSGGLWNVYDTIRLIDVSALYRPQEAAPEQFQPQPAPRWLADIAGAASALDPGGDGSLLTLKTVRKRYPKSKAGNPYESVWKRFFPNDPGTP